MDTQTRPLRKRRARAPRLKQELEYKPAVRLSDSLQKPGKGLGGCLAANTHLDVNSLAR